MADDSDNQFNLKLQGEGISIEKMVNRHVAMAVVAAVFGGGSPAVPIQVTPNVGAGARSQLSPREFLNESGASSNAEKITALGHFYCEHKSRENFSRDDVREGFGLAHEAIPKNLPRDFGTAISAGWIHKAPGKTGNYYVTNTGIHLVESNFKRAKG